MSQPKVYKILKELGGEATNHEISIRAKEKFPKHTLHLYVNDRLHRLEKRGYVKKNGEGRKAIWIIIASYP